jgi:hypothetical protein
MCRLTRLAHQQQHHLTPSTRREALHEQHSMFVIVSRIHQSCVFMDRHQTGATGSSAPCTKAAGGK